MNELFGNTGFSNRFENAQQAFLESEACALQQQAARRSAACGGLGLGLGLGALGSSAGAAPRPEKYKPVARIGKVTPKPGYIMDSSHPDGVRLRGWADYSWDEKPIVAWIIFKLWLRT